MFVKRMPLRPGQRVLEPTKAMKQEAVKAGIFDSPFALTSGPLRTSGYYSSPRAAIALIRSPVRQAIAWIVSDGLTPPTVGNTDPSQIQRLRMSPKAALMATTAERQAAYRKRRATAGENGERRINTWVTTGAALALARLARRYAVTNREMVERLIIAADEDITATLDPTSPEWAAYFDVAA
jgi:hypothetical protein